MNEVEIKIELSKLETRVCSPRLFKEVIDRLLKLGYDGLLTDRNGMTPLIYAAKYSYKELIESVLLHFTDIDIDNHIFSKPVHIETNVGNSLFDGTSYANSNLMKIVNVCGPSGNSALYYAADNKCFDIACTLLLHGADISCLEKERLKEILLYSVEEIVGGDYADYSKGYKLIPIFCLLAIIVPEALKIDKERKWALLDRFTFLGHSKVVAILIESESVSVRAHVCNTLELFMLGDYDYMKMAKCLFEPVDLSTVDVTKFITNCAKRGHLETVKFFLKRKDVSKKHLYMYGSATVEITAFIWNNYREYKVDSKGNTALHYATSGNTLDSIKYLCENGANVNSLNNIGETPLDKAIKTKCIEVIKYLILEYDAQPGGSYLMQDAYKRIKRFLEAKHNVEFENLLLEAIAASDILLIESLVTQGININCLNASGMTPLHFAVQNTSSVATEFLLQHGALYDIPTKNNETALNLSEYDNEVILKHVDKLFKSSNLAQDLKKINAKTKWWNSKCFQINVRNREGQTLLHKAVGLNDEDAINELIRCNKLYIDRKRRKWYCNPDFITLQYYVPMNIGAQDFEGNTALHLAAKNGNIKIATQLIDEDKNVINIKNNLGHTALFVAEHRKHTNFVQFLLKRIDKHESA